MRKISLLITAVCISVSSLVFANDDKHEMENYHAKIDATEHHNSRFIESKTVKGKEYVHGKGSSYNKKGEANGGKALWPYMEYKIASKTGGGKYNLTIHYRVEKDKLPDNPRILVGMDLQDAQELEIKQKVLNNTVKASFHANFLKGKNHNIKIWLPSEGVEIERIDVRRALIAGKKDK
ncbi:MAG: hypothetical protein ACRCSQ_07995 [Bacteroidales bacterium]